MDFNNFPVSWFKLTFGCDSGLFWSQTKLSRGKGNENKQFGKLTECSNGRKLQVVPKSGNLVSMDPQGID